MAEATQAAWRVAAWAQVDPVAWAADPGSGDISDPSAPQTAHQVDPSQVDPRLIVQAASGDASAFDQLMQRDQVRLYRVALHLLGRPEDAEEALQEAFLRIHRGLGSYDPERSWQGWTYRIVVNCCRTKAARRALGRWFSLDAWRESGGQDPVTPGLGPEARLEALDRRKRLLRAVARLPRKERAALTLTAIEGLSAGEAAEVLGSSEGTVRSQASRAREKLREWLRAEGR